MSYEIIIKAVRRKRNGFFYVTNYVILHHTEKKKIKWILRFLTKTTL
jgi:hypothetical protein